MAFVHGDLHERDDIFSGVGNALSSLFNPIFPGQATSTTSTSATLTLTTSPTATQTDTDAQSSTLVATQTLTSQTKSTGASTSSSSTASTSSSASVSSASTSAGTSSTSTSARTATSTSPPSVTTSVGPNGTVTLTETSSASSASASTTAAANAATSKGFLANKGLSVGVITACSLIGLVLLIVVATYTIRRRRRNKLHEEAVDFTPFPSSDELLGHGSDVERGGGGGLGGTLTRLSSKGSTGDDALPSAAPEMYQTGYAIPTYVPPPGPAQPPKAATTSTTNQVAFPAQMYTNTASGFNEYGPYPTYVAPVNPNAYQPQPATNMLAPRPGPSYNATYGAAPAAAGTAPANPPVRKGSQRKQVPPLNLSAARPDASPPAYQLVNDTSASPMVNPYGATLNPIPPPLSAVSPASRRTSASLLNSPVRLAYSDDGASTETGANEKASARKRASSYSRMLDPSLPTLPAAAPLPDEFGAQAAPVVADEKAAVRHLAVRNE